MTSQSEEKPPEKPPGEQSGAVQATSAWVLRIGVILSAVVMLIGVGFSFFHGTISIDRMTHEGFEISPAKIFQGISAGRGKDIVEAGVLLLVLTPVMRVAASMIIFATVQRDRLYALITAIVLALTLVGLIWG